MEKSEMLQTSILLVSVSLYAWTLMGWLKTSKETKKPIDLVMSKIWIGNDAEESKRIQERLIELGCYWQTGKEKEKFPKYLEQTSCIFIDAGLRLTFLNTTHKVFLESYHDEIKASQLF